MEKDLKEAARIGTKWHHPLMLAAGFILEKESEVAVAKGQNGNIYRTEQLYRKGEVAVQFFDGFGTYHWTASVPGKRDVGDYAYKIQDFLTALPA